jgi:hypothetical protein
MFNGLIFFVVFSNRQYKGGGVQARANVCHFHPKGISDSRYLRIPTTSLHGPLLPQGPDI